MTRGFFLSVITMAVLGSNSVFGQQVSTTQAQRHAAILKHLSGKAIYDKHTQVSYIFESVPTDPEVLAVAARNNIFFAEPNKLIVGGDQKTLAAMQKMGLNPIQVANDVYEITVTGDIVAKKAEIAAILNVSQIVYKYTAYTLACSSFNDPQVRPTGTRQNWLQDAGWIANGVSNPTTHDIDSVQSRKTMHVPSTPANPNIVVNIFDGGFDDTNPEFQGRVIWKWNFVNNSATTSATGHGSSVASLAVATGNNNYGGVGLYDGPIRMYQISSDGLTINVANLHKAIDSLIQVCLVNPNQRQINNFSFASGNDPIFYAKLKQLYNMNGQKQNFCQAGTGNNGVTGLAWPAAWPECTARGATTSQSTKTIWSGSNRGPEMIDHGYVNDGQGVWAMQANGTFAEVTGTSFSTPLAPVANIVAQDTSRTNADVRAILDEGARDLGATGADEIYGKGWARTGRSLTNAVVRHVPNAFNAAVIPSYNFIPKYYNGLQTTNEKVYVNGTSTPITPTINANGQAEFLLSFTTAAGFVNGVNSIRYEFTTADGCVTKIFKDFTLSNVQVVTSINPAQGGTGGIIKFYPNPVSKSHYLYISNLPTGVTKLIVTFYSVQGVQVHQVMVAVTGTTGRMAIPATLSRGMYFIKLQDAGSRTRYSGIETINIQ